MQDTSKKEREAPVRTLTPITILMAVIVSAILAMMPFPAAAQERPLHDWSDAPEIFPGIRHVFLDTDTPRPLKINVLQIDLTRKDLGFMTAKRDPDWGKPMPDHPSLPIRVRRQTSRDFLLESRKNGIDMLTAVNATLWSPFSTSRDYRYGALLGLVISDGQLVDEVLEKYPRPTFIITKTGEYQIRIVNKDEDLSGIQLAVSGYHMVLENGKIIAGQEKKTKLAPRTGLGLSAGCRYLILMTIDGRMPTVSEGVSIREVGDWMRRFGAETAMNMDGGGSTTMVVFDGKDDVRKLNVAPDYRKVATSLGVYRIRKEKTSGQPEK